jgi:hypothetical protein
MRISPNDQHDGSSAVQVNTGASLTVVNVEFGSSGGFAIHEIANVTVTGSITMKDPRSVYVSDALPPLRPRSSC